MGLDRKWVASGGGDVTTGSNWLGGTPPGTADEGEFAGPGGTITGNISVAEWVIDPGAGLYTFTGDTTATYFDISASASLDGVWTQNGGSFIDIAAGTFTMGSTAELISNNSASNVLDLVVDGALVANGGTIAIASVIGIGSAGAGTLSLNSNATLSAASIQLAVQSGASGTLDLSGGATASISRYMLIGAATGGTGSVDVTDAGSDLNAGSNQVEIGAGGTGTLTVENGATLSAGALDIGVGSAGIFNIESGATVTSGSAALALLSKTNVPGTVTVLLDAAEWLSSGQIQVGAGSGGSAGLQIEDGATLQATATLASDLPFLVVDENVAGNAGVDIGGATTVLDAGRNSVIIGASGFGALTMHDGAQLDAGNIGSQPAFMLGELSGSVGTATLTGPTTDIDVTGNASIGQSGAGTLDIGGTFTATGNMDLAVTSTASGTVDVSGTGSDLALSGQLVIGGGATAGGTGAVTVASGGTLTAGSLYLYTGGTLTIDSTSGAEIGTANMGVTGQLVVDTGETADGSGKIAASVTNHGDVVAQGGTLTITGQATGGGLYEISTGSVLDLEQPGDVKLEFQGSTGTADLGTASGTASLEFFSGNDTLRIVGIGAGATSSVSGDTATIAGPDGSWAFTFAGPAPHLNVTTQGVDALVTLCFAEGTLIATPRGEVPVERLSPGDRVVTLRGEARRIVWIGTGRVLATRGRRSAATPVIVRKGALGSGVPHHDLRVTKGHALHIGGALIPVEFLVNHRSIQWDDRAQEVAIYHVELETHDVLLANGAPAESYRDDGNRWLFQNANSGWELPPREPCAPLLTGGPVVDTIWRRLLDRAGPRPGMLLTEDPDLHVLVGAERVDPVSCRGAAYVFQLPAEQPSVRLVSRAGIPAELGLARDPRALGVAVRRVVLRRGTAFRLMEAADPALADGFHAFEPDSGLRWTDGDAGLPMALFEGFDGPMELVVHVGSTAQYMLPGELFRVAAA